MQYGGCTKRDCGPRVVKKKCHEKIQDDGQETGL